MNKRIWLVIGLLSLVLLIFWGSSVYAQARWTGTGWQPYGMMGGWNGQNYGPGTVGRGTMGPGMMGGGMMGGWGHPGWSGYRGLTPSGTPIALDEAVVAVEQYLDAYGNSNLVVSEVMEFSNNLYAVVEEENTGIHAFELLLDRYTGAIHPEPGPNMMWNTKYGHMGGWRRWTSGSMTVTPEEARGYAERWLDTYLPGTTAADHADAFYGYYTMHVLTDGEISGMLSVNGYSGQVWYHNWHGAFVGMEEMHE